MKYMTFIYVVIIIVIIILLIKLFIELSKFSKKLDTVKLNRSNLDENINLSNDKIDEIKSTKRSWKFFFTIYLTYTLIKELITDFKKESKRKVITSLSKTAIKSVGKINKIV